MKIDVMSEFSDEQCRIEVTHAVSHYRAQVPELYRSDQHNLALKAASQMFRESACGPALPAALKKMAEECTDIWKTGRQLCEATSATGARCALPVHLFPGEAPDNVTGRGECQPCRTSVVMVRTCACGSTLKEIDEPFTLAQANEYFVEEDCCANTVTETTLYLAVTGQGGAAGGSAVAPAVASPRRRPDAVGVGVARKQGASMFDEAALAELTGVVSLSSDPTSQGRAEALPLGLGFGAGIAAVSGFQPIPAWKCCKIGLRSDYSPTAGLGYLIFRDHNHFSAVIAQHKSIAFLVAFQYRQSLFQGLYCCDRFDRSTGFLSGANLLLPWDTFSPQADSGGAGRDSKRSAKSGTAHTTTAAAATGGGKVSSAALPVVGGNVWKTVAEVAADQNLKKTGTKTTRCTSPT